MGCDWKLARRCCKQTGTARDVRERSNGYGWRWNIMLATLFQSECVVLGRCNTSSVVHIFHHASWMVAIWTCLTGRFEGLLREASGSFDHWRSGGLLVQLLVTSWQFSVLFVQAILATICVFMEDPVRYKFLNIVPTVVVCMQSLGYLV